MAAEGLVQLAVCECNEQLLRVNPALRETPDFCNLPTINCVAAEGLEPPAFAM